MLVLGRQCKPPLLFPSLQLVSDLCAWQRAASPCDSHSSILEYEPIERSCVTGSTFGLGSALRHLPCEEMQHHRLTRQTASGAQRFPASALPLFSGCS